MPAIARYAERTTVEVAKTKEAITDLLERYQCEGYGVNIDRTNGGCAAVIPFQLYGWNIVFRRKLPRPDDPQFARPDRYGNKPAPAEITAAYRTEERRRWRSIYMQLKAKLEAVLDEDEADREEAFRREFLGDALLVDGRRMVDWAVPQLDAAYRSGQMPPLLPGGRPALPSGS